MKDRINPFPLKYQGQTGDELLLSSGVENEEKCDVLLVSAPWAAITSPSIQLSLLKPIVQARGFKCHVLYANLQIVNYIDPEIYDIIQEELLIGEWMFSAEVSNTFIPKDARYSDYLDYWDYRTTEETGTNALRLRLGKGWKEKIYEIREKVIPQYLRQVLGKIQDHACKVIGFTTSFEQNNPSLALSKLIKQKSSDTAIVFGGANCETPMGPALLENFPFVDYVITGEGERAFPILLSHILSPDCSGPRLCDIKGLSYRKDKCVEVTGRPEPVPLATLPFLDCDDYYRQIRRIKSGNSISVKNGPIFFECSRGCWWGAHSQCTFCGLNGLSIDYRSKPAHRVFEEIIYLSRRHKALKFAATDNILNPSYFVSLMPRLKETGYDFDLFFEVKATMTKNHVKLISDAGVRVVQPGIESLSTHVLQIMKKGTTMLQNIQALKWFEEFNIRARWNFLWGFPGETEEDYLEIELLIPKIFHLPPPTSHLHRIRLDRFSPNFDFAEELGITNVRPREDYCYVYNIRENALRQMAYFFDYDVDGTDNILPHVCKIDKLIDDWRANYNSRRLHYRRGPSFVEIIDTRGNSPRRFVFSDIYRDVFLCCDEIRTLDHIVSLLKKKDPNVQEDEVIWTLEEIKKSGIIVQECGKYLSLAVSEKPAINQTLEKGEITTLSIVPDST
jgi:ribosomal peptide maturation radical SAM protein 1